MEIPPQLELLEGFNGYIDVFDIAHPIPVTMEQMNLNPPMFVSLIVKNQIPKLQNLDAFLINSHLPPNLIDLNCDDNLITILPQLPEDMEFLSCNNNLITNLVGLPDTLQYLYCNNNKLSLLPEILPHELVILSCNRNKLVSLPQLDNLINLMNLQCSHNQLSFLPNFFIGEVDLSTLNCSHNRLQGLPILPGNLRELNCYKNSIFGLPDLPANLIKLNCSYNQINGIPVLPASLEKLNISYNPIIGSIANIILPNSLKKFYCHNCQITNLPETLPNLLEDFKCANNAINYLPNLPNGLKRFNCSNNNLTVMPDLPDSLRELYCRGNTFNDESINKIIAFYQNAIANGFPNTKPTFQEELDYFQIHRSKTFINAFAETPQGTKGQFISNNQGNKLKATSIPGRSMRKIMAYGNLPYPPAKKNPLGGQTKKNINKKSKKLMTAKNRRKKKTLKKRFK